MPQTDSQYAVLAYLASMTLFVGLFVVLAIIAAVLLLATAPTRRRATVAGVLLTVASASFNFFLAFTASFEFLPIAATVILSLLYDLLAAPFIAVLFSRGYGVLFRLPREAATKEKADADVDPRGDTEIVDKAAPVPNSDDPDITLDTTGSSRLVLFRRALGSAVVPQLVALYTSSVLLILILHLTLAHGCFCSSPNEFTTWASRGSQTAPCRRHEVCHAYTLVGGHCSTLTFVAHYVASSEADAPMAAVLEWWPANVTGAPVQSARAGPTGEAVTTSFRGRIVVDKPIREDWRVVAQFAVAGLACGAHYRVRVRFLHGDGAPAAASEDVFATLPSDAQVNGGARGLRFIGGGDLYVGGDGQKLFDVLWREEPQPDFVLVGGDIAYANNMRYCYRRWDVAFRIALRRRADGAMPPMMGAVGNHEAGGYLRASTREGRQRAYAHYTTYFPSADFLSDFALFPPPRGGTGATTPALPPATADALPALHRNATFAAGAEFRGDDTVTFYRAFVGNTAWVVLDSDIMLTAASQAALLDETLAHFAALRRAGQVKALVVMYHCPGLPSVRAFDNPQAVQVRRHFYPAMLRHNVSLVLENHDHAYKRSHAIRSERADGTGELRAAAGGTVFVGDGALGVASSVFRKIHRQWYHDVVQRSNAGFVLAIDADGRVAGRALSETGEAIDTFVV